MLNKVILQCRLTAHPELRYTTAGTPLTTMHVAHNRRVKQGEELKEEVCFVEVVAFGKQAEHCSQYLTKGSQVLLEGRLQHQRWEQEDGQKRSKHVVVAESVTFLDKKGETNE